MFPGAVVQERQVVSKAHGFPRPRCYRPLGTEGHLAQWRRWDASPLTGFAAIRFAGKEVDIMTASSEALYLPMLSPVRSPYPECFPKRRRAPDPQQAWQTPVHRLHQRGQPQFAYGPKGHAAPPPATGHIIDIYA